MIFKIPSLKAFLSSELDTERCSFLQLMIPGSDSGHVLTKICVQRITDVKVPAGTRIRVSNNKLSLVASPQETVTHLCDTFLHREFKYDLMNFNSEHFVMFVRCGHAVCSQVSESDSAELELTIKVFKQQFLKLFSQTITFN